MKTNGFYNPGSKCVGYQKLTVGAVAAALTLPSLAQTFVKSALIIIEANATTKNNDATSISFREDGVDPAVATGMPLKDGDVYIINMPNLENIKFISGDGNSQTIHIQYYS